MRNGGAAILSETSEIYGAEHLLTRRAATPAIGQKIVDLIHWWEAYAARNGGELNNNPSPGNKAGGLTTILEKSLGAAAKGGTTIPAVQDSEVTYALGFYPVDIKLDGRYHSLKVKVARDGVDLRNRKGYFATDLKQPTESQRKQTLNEVFDTPLEATGIGIAALLEPYARQAGVFQLTLSLNLQELHLEREKNNWVAQIELATYFPAAAKPNGTDESIKLTLTEPRLRQALASGYTLQRLIVVGNRKGDMRLAIQDQVSGAAGSVKLQLAAAGKPNPKNGQ